MLLLSLYAQLKLLVLSLRLTSPVLESAFREQQRFFFFRMAPSQEKKKFCILKQVVKLNMSEASPWCILYPAIWKAHSSCTDSKQRCPHALQLRQAVARIITYLSFLLVLQHAFSLVGNFFCFLTWWHLCAIPSDTSDVNITEPDSYFIVSSKSKDCWTT